MAAHGALPAYVEIERATPILPGPGTLIGRTAMSWQVVRIDDVLIDPLYEKKGDARIGRFRSAIGVPLMRENEPIGVLGLCRSRVEPFSDREIELTMTFADQAAIAIEHARLFEAEQQRTRELPNRWNSRQPRRTCFRLSAALLAIYSRCLTPCWKTPSASATPNGERSIAGTVSPCTSWRRIICLLPMPKRAGGTVFVPIRILFWAASRRPKRWFILPIWPNRPP